jgi:hypothetical protein
LNPYQKAKQYFISCHKEKDFDSRSFDNKRSIFTDMWKIVGSENYKYYDMAATPWSFKKNKTYSEYLEIINLAIKYYDNRTFI